MKANIHTTPPPRFCDMTDDELAREIEALIYDTTVIGEQLAIDQEQGNPRGRDWWRTAGIAKGFKSAHLKLARAEMLRRTERQNDKEKVERAAAFAARLDAERAVLEAKTRDRDAATRERESAAELRKVETAHAHALRQLAQAETSSAWEKRNARRARCFLIAARRLLTPDQMDAVWARAEELFPDMPRLQDAVIAERKDAA